MGEEVFNIEKALRGKTKEKRIEKRKLETVQEKKFKKVEINPIDNYINKWLEGNSSFLAVLGEYGTGKSTLCKYIVYNLAKARLDKEKETEIKDLKCRIPIFFPLSKFRQEDIRNFIISELNLIGIKDIDYSSFIEKVKNGEFVLLFDAFDEMAAKIDEFGKISNFGKIKEIIESSEESKVLLTSREEYFRSKEELNEVFQIDNIIKVEAYIIKVKLINEEQIQRFLIAFTETPEKIWNQLKKSNDLLDLAQRTVLLKMITKWWGKILEEKKVGDGFKSVNLYEKAITGELKEKSKNASVANYPFRLKVLQKVAVKMYLNSESLSLNTNQMKEELKNDDFYKDKNSFEINEFLTEFHTYTFWVPDGEQRFKISHKSFRDFLVAKEFVKEINENKIVNFSKIKTSDEIDIFILQLNPNKEDFLKVVKSYKYRSEDNKWLGTNVINLLLKIDSDSLFGEDFTDTFFEELNLSKINLRKTNFTNSIFKDCKFGMNIFESKFKTAKFENSNADLIKLSELKNLDWLDLSFTEFYDIEFLSELKKLKTLSLKSTNVIDIRALSKLENLDWLSLSSTKVSDVSALSELKNLTSLYLSYTQVKRKDVEILKRKLPNCRIFY